MNAQAAAPVLIEVPPLLAGLIDQLVPRMASATGESPEAVRRAVEISVLSRGVAAVQAEIRDMEKQVERMGWNT